MNISEYNGVWVFAEQRNGELQKVSFANSQITFVYPSVV